MWDIGGYCETVKYSTSAPSYDGAALFIELTIAVGSERTREPLALSLVGGFAKMYMELIRAVERQLSDIIERL